MKTRIGGIVIAVSILAYGFHMTGCGGGSRTIATPLLTAVQTALGLNNTYGMVPGLALGAITLPPCTKQDGTTLDFTATYTMTGLPAWLAFDATTLAVTLATGTVVPAEANTEAEVTYTCTDASDPAVTASLIFTINDLDGGGVVDGKEYENGAVPLVNYNGYFSLNPANVNRYRVSPNPFKIPDGIVRPTVGMDPADAADDIADFDGDTLTNFQEITGNTNPFVYGTDGLFGAVATYPQTNPAIGITSADFNNDGILDIAVIDGVNQVAVLLGNGDGTLGAGTDFAVGTLPSELLAADFNGDGNMDLAVVNNIDANVSVLLGDGTGSFGAQSVYAVGPAPFNITAADFNNDGVVDLAASNQAAGTVSILLGRGDGTFGAKTDYATGVGPQGVTAADFNGDGNMDIAVANNLAGLNTFSVFLGNGDGTFDAKIDYATGTQPLGIISADFNGDSIIDIAVTTSANTVAVNLGVGNGSFAAKTEFATGNTPQSIIAADFNGDNKVDLATGNTAAGSYSVSVLLGAGDGTFSANTNYTVPNLPTDLTTCDLNGDGALDFAVSLGNLGKDVGVLLGQL